MSKVEERERWRAGGCGLGPAALELPLQADPSKLGGMGGYYAQKLSGERLRRCYEIASPRVKQYLEAEIDHVLRHLEGAAVVLELGCGYGRVATRLAEIAPKVIGIDTSEQSLRMARAMADPGADCEFISMDATELGFPDGTFDVVVCIQNGICAFGVDRESLLREALRVTRTGGIALFSSYSDAFWHHRLAWFESQAAEGLVGELDYSASADGVIVCKDGFRAGRSTPKEFEALCVRLGVTGEIAEVDGSSVFCKIVKPRSS